MVVARTMNDRRRMKLPLAKMRIVAVGKGKRENLSPFITRYNNVYLPLTSKSVVSKQRSKVLSEFYVKDDIILIPVTTTPALVLGYGVELMMLMKFVSLIVHK